MDFGEAIEALESSNDALDSPRVLINQGDGIYKINIQLKIKVEADSIQLLRINNVVKKDFSRLNKIPDGFMQAMIETDPDITEAMARKFYDTIRLGGREGATKRQIMRACGGRLTKDMVDNVIFVLLKLNWIVFRVMQNGGKGRPRHVLVLREMADPAPSED